MRKKYFFFCLVFLLFFLPGFSQFQPGDGPYQPLITAEADAGGKRVKIIVTVDPDYHITDLKNGFFRVELAPLDEVAIESVKFPPGVPFEDETVFKDRVEIEVSLKTVKAFENPLTLTFTVSYQICQESPTALCFAPDSSNVEVVLPPQKSPAPTPPPTLANESKTEAPAENRAEPASIAVPVEKLGTEGSQDLSAPDVVEAENKDNLQEEAVPEEKPGKGWLRRIVSNPKRFIETEFQRKSFLLFLGVFLLGFLTSLTPCVYPVIPIVMGFVGSRSGKSKWKGFVLSLVFVLGLSLVYSILGIVAALAGQGLGFSFQNPWVAGFIAVVFIAMGLSMAGFFSIPVPSSLSSKMGKGPKSGIISAFFIGAISALIAAPCAGPVLISLLTVISESKQVFLGFWVTLTFSLGMCLIFLAVGTFSGLVSSLPRGGGWMEKIKYFFSLLLIAGGIYVLGMVTPPSIIRIVWGVFLISVSIWMGLFSPMETGAGHAPKFKKLVSMLLLLLGVFLFWKGLAHGESFGPVPTGEQSIGELIWNSDLSQTLRQAKSQNKPVLIDFTADWCVYCKKMDRTTFADAGVREKLSGYILVRLDMTTEAQKSVHTEGLNRFGIRGRVDPPTLIFLDPSGVEIKRMVGYIDAKKMNSLLDELH